MKKKQLLYIGNRLSKKGNTVSSIETLGSFLQEYGYTVFLSSNKKNKIIRLLDMFYSVFIYRNKVSTVLIDTYSTHNFYFAVGVAFLCRVFKIPYIPILRGGNLPSRLKKSPYKSKKLFSKAASNIAPSLYLYQEFKNFGFHNIQLIPNSIQLKKYPFLQRKKVSARLLWVRSFSNIYNPQLALQIVKALKQENIPVSLTMVGPEKDGSLATCKAYVYKHQLPVTFTGKLSKSEWTALAASHDIFINTTNFDNTPVSVIEAMALGMPVISTNVGGLPALITNNVEGILLAPNNSTLFVNQIKKLTQDPVLVEKLSKNARLKAGNFDWDVVKLQWQTVIDACK